MPNLYHRRRGFPQTRDTQPPTKWMLELSNHAADYHANGRKYVSGIDLPRAILYKDVGSVYAIYNEETDALNSLTTSNGAELLSGHMFELATYETHEGGDRNVSKVGLRFDYDDEHDLTIITDPLESPPPESTVYSPHSDETPVGTIISCWLNKKNDQHDTLDLSRYEPVKQTA